MISARRHLHPRAHKSQIFSAEGSVVSRLPRFQTLMDDDMRNMWTLADVQMWKAAVSFSLSALRR